MGRSDVSKIKKLKFTVKWSKEDKEWAGLCSEYPSLSWMDKDLKKALKGIKKLVKQIEEEDRP